MFNNYTFNDKEEVLPEDEFDETVEDEIEYDEEEIEEEMAIGVISGCTRLNVRLEPNIDAEVIATVKADDEVIVDEEASDEYFYSVCTKFGIEGFCLKDYIVIQ